MTLLKIITALNWIVIAILGVLVLLETIFPAKGGDAAGRGIGQAIYFLAIIALVILLVLNILPYNWAKYTAFTLIGIPIMYFTLAPTIRKIKKGIKDRAEYAKPIFPDEARDKAARAIYENKPEQLKKLLEQPISTLNQDGELLTFAIHFTRNETEEPEKKMECLRLLFQAGARLDSIQAEVPIHFSVAEAGNAALMRLLLEQGADANAVQPYFKRPIIFEAINSYFQPDPTVRTLLEFGADPNSKAVMDDEQGPITPLLWAAQTGRWNICALLLEKGADASIKTKNGLSLQSFVDEAGKNFSEDGYSKKADFERLKQMMH